MAERDPRMDEASEAKLVARLVRRDERAFNELVRLYERRVFALVYRITGSGRRTSEAEDLTQEVFVQVFKAIDTFRGDAKLSTWIFRIAVNLCSNRAKYHRVRHEQDAASLDDPEGGGPSGDGTADRPGQVARPDEMARGKELEKIVQRAIASLEPAFRECFVLRDLEELSYDEITQITGLPEGTVKSRIHRARALLRVFIERELGESIE